MPRKDPEDRREFERQQWIERKRAGLCPHCGKVPAVSVCNSCRSGLRATQRKFAAKKRAFRRDHGLCEHCGEQLPTAEYVTCEKCRKKKNAYYKGKYREKKLAIDKSWRSAIRSEAISAYGGPKCVCCGETGFEFMTLDHINGDGKLDKGTSHRSGYGLYAWLKAQNWPSGFRVLCMNCNWAYGRFGYCPHRGDS